MLLKRWSFFFPLATLLLGLAGCGGGSTANVRNPTGPPVTKVSIGFQPTPAGSIFINATAALNAVVSSDSSNAGVDWSVTCSNAGHCGSLTPLHTASGQPTTYAPPASFSGNSQSVRIVAFATADHSQNIVAPLTVSAFGSNFKGTYVLQAQGVDTSFGPYQFAGVITLDGNGGITAGEQTVNFFDQNAGTMLSKSDPVTGGSYFLGADGRGTITINTADLDLGQSGTETFSLVFLSASQALIAQADPSASATGTMDLQTAVATPARGYAFVVSGTDVVTQSPTSFGGVINIDSPNTISGKGSISDLNLAGTLSVRQSLSGTVSNPDPFGAVTIQLTTAFAPTPIQFTGYIVDATHIRLIESDNVGGGGYASTGGNAIGQGLATGTFLSTASFSGTYVVDVVGTDLAGYTPNTLTSVSLLTADGNGGLANGFTDTFLQQNSAQGNVGSQISAAFIGAYTVDAKGTGRVRSVFNHFAPAPHPGYAPVTFFYLTGNGNPPLVLDGSDISGAHNYPSLGTGIAYPQATSLLTFSAKYGLTLVQQNGSESDATGQILVDSGTNFSGGLDVNSNLNPTFNDLISGTFQPPSIGRFSGTLAGQIFTFSPFAVDFYPIDSNHGFFVETDLVNPNGPSGVVSLGYYSGRTPVCTGCQ